MRFLTAIIDALIGFVQRNPLTVLLIVILALGAPALLKGIAVFILYFLLGLVVLVAAVLLLFRWRIGKVRRQMEEQFGEGFGGADGFGGRSPFANGSGSPFGQEPPKGREGEVKVHKTAETPGKRVSKSVGDYVEFEETKEETKEN